MGSEMCIRDSLKEKFGWPVFIISAAARKGLDPLKYKLMEMVTEHYKAQPKPRRDPKHSIIHPKAQAHKKNTGSFADFTIARDPEVEGGFIVEGEKIERWITQTDFENDEAVGYLADRLAKAGVEDELRAQGAVEGCPVTIGGITFEWEPMTGGDPTMASRGEDARLKGTSRVSAAERKRASQAAVVLSMNTITAPTKRSLARVLIGIGGKASSVGPLFLGCIRGGAL